MTCVLLQIDSSRGIDMAVEYNTTPKRANACSPVPGRFIAIYPRAFSKLFPGQDLTPADKLAKGSTFETWIKKIDSVDDVTSEEQKQTCQVKLNTGQQTNTKVHFGTVINLDVKNAMQEEASKRGYSISRLVETILVNWLNAANGKKFKIPTDPATKMRHGAYALGQIAAKEYEIFNKVALEEYIFTIPGKKLTALKKRLVSEYHFTKDVGELFKKIPQDLNQRQLNRRNYILFFAGFCGIDWNVADQVK